MFFNYNQLADICYILNFPINDVKVNSYNYGNLLLLTHLINKSKLHFIIKYNGKILWLFSNRLSLCIFY